MSRWTGELNIQGEKNLTQNNTEYRRWGNTPQLWLWDCHNLDTETHQGHYEHWIVPTNLNHKDRYSHPKTEPHNVEKDI